MRYEDCETLGVSIEPAVKEAFRLASAEVGRSMSKQVVWLIKQWLAARAAEHDAETALQAYQDRREGVEV